MTEHRQCARGAVLLSTQLRIDGEPGEHAIRVRNLSSGGLMGEGWVPLMRGSRVAVMIDPLGWVPGRVAWIHGDRFGVAFTYAIEAGPVAS